MPETGALISEGPRRAAFFECWEAWATRSRLKPMFHAAGIIRRHRISSLAR